MGQWDADPDVGEVRTRNLEEPRDGAYDRFVENQRRLLVRWRSDTSYMK